MADIHTRIKDTRINKKLSQAKLATLTGVSQPTVANWENGSHIPRQAALKLISVALEVEEGWLLSGESGQIHASVQSYLARPIRHIPIYEHPLSGTEIFVNAPVGYLPYPTSHENSFALIDLRDADTHNRILIFQPNIPNTVRVGGQYLWANDTRLELNLLDEIPADAPILGRLRTEVISH